ncbi:MAG TPA: phosphotransferase, partial [Candidatus Saccharibacteria bacterium]|nr:phosphotransferase [Candidatus Saccharibacteria bacterium]
MEAVREKGIPVPNAIARPDGSSFGYDSVLGRFFALFEFMVGDILDEGFSRWSVKQIAECLDVLYEVSIESRELVRNDDSFNQSIISRAQKAYAELDNYPGKEIPNVLVVFFDSCMKDNQRVSDLAEGLIHGDVKIQNLLFNNMILSALLDFDDCRKSYVIEDVVMALMHNLHSIDDCLIRSEYAQEFIDSISNPRLRQELRSGLSVLIKWRLLYELSKLLLNDNRSHFDILLQDAFIQRIIEDKEFIKV